MSSSSIIKKFLCVNNKTPSSFQMKIIIPHGHSRPFGILSNSSLSIRIGQDLYPTVDHFMMATLLLKEEDRKHVLSHASLAEARVVFNALDEKQYLTIVRDACHRFHQKKSRSTHIDPASGRSIGNLFRDALLANPSAVFDYLALAPEIPLKTIVGVTPLSDSARIGYNVLGQTLGMFRILLAKLKMPVGLEHLIWRFHSDEKQKPAAPRADRIYRLRPPIDKDTADEDVDKDDAEVVEFLPTLMEDEDEDDNPEKTREEIDLLPEPPQIDKKKKIKTRAPPFVDLMIDQNPASYLDPIPLDQFVIPQSIYEIHTVATILVDQMKGGRDILHLQGKSMGEILWQFHPHRPESSARTVISCWEMFRAGRLPHQALVETEIMYPGNLVGFVRKAHISNLNANIGVHIREILFRALLRRVVVESYPSIPSEWIERSIRREASLFSPLEYTEITNRLYHLYYDQKFNLRARDAIRIGFLEMNRKTPEEIETALHFLPVSAPAPVALLSGSILDPLFPIHATIKGRLYEDFFQYLFDQLFQAYGGVSAEEAYRQLHSDGQLLPGTHPLLQERLSMLIEIRRKRLLEDALRVKVETYPQIRELLLYVLTTGSTIHFEELLDRDTDRAFRRIAEDAFSVEELARMRFVVGFLPDSPLHFEKSIFLYSFLADFLRSLHLFKTLLGQGKIDARGLQIFIKCFYSPLMTLGKSDEGVAPEGLLELATTDLRDTDLLWRTLSPYLRLFLDPDFVPSRLFQEARVAAADKDTDPLRPAADALLRVLSCLYGRDAEIPLSSFYLITQILSGRDDLPPWPDSSFELVMEEDVDDSLPPNFHLLPAEIRNLLEDRLHKKKKKARKEKKIHTYNILHAETSSLAPHLRKILSHPATISRLSFAVVALARHVLHPHRLQFFLGSDYQKKKIEKKKIIFHKERKEP